MNSEYGLSKTALEEPTKAVLQAPPAPELTLLRLMASDFKARAVWIYGETSSLTMLKAVCADGAFAMVTFRLMEWCQNRRLKPVAMVFNKLNIWFGGCVIGRGARFGPGFVLIHSGGVVINSEVRGGANVRIEHQVTIGAEKGGSPLLGDHVFIGAGAKILGPIRIGSHVRVGANAVVIRDVPDHATAVGVPARLIEAQPASG